MSQPTIFADSGLPTALVDNLRRFNPWWEGEAMPVQPPTQRHLVGQIRRRLNVHVAPIVVVRGPRQIGKTTAQFQIIQDLLQEGVDPRRIVRVQFDDLGTLKRLREPILRISDWFERHITPGRFNTLAQAGSPAYLFFDEIQNLDGWDAQLKSLVDIDPFRDTLGIRSFLEKSLNNAPFGILVTQDYSGTLEDPPIVTLPLSTFMMLR